MALGGTYEDFHKDVFMDMLMHEAQDKGSRLRQIANIEMMEGNKTYFQKTGSVASSIKNTRLEKRTYAAHTHERRQVQETLAEYSTAIDVEDLIKNVANPKSDLVRAALMEMGRRMDDVILEAISGNSVVTENGSTSNQGLTQTVAVNDHSFDAGSGDVGLTVSKLKVAIATMSENYGYDGTQRLICIAPMRQIIGLTQEDQFVSGDFRGVKPLEGPGVVPNASGFLGIDFIAFERTGLDSNGDEKAFLMTDDAIKVGVYKPLYVDLFKDYSIVGSPDAIAVGEAVGAARMYEEKVVEIACDPAGGS